jgi:hypothetical protein
MGKGAGEGRGGGCGHVADQGVVVREPGLGDGTSGKVIARGGDAVAAGEVT